jgi:hypothetical protein
VPFREVAMDINEHSIAGYVALTGEIVNIEDAYHLPADVPYSINRKFDEDSGYRTMGFPGVIDARFRVEAAMFKKLP